MIKADDFEEIVKIVVIGNGNVGKSSLIRQFGKDHFIQSYNKTIGVEYHEREILLECGKSVKLMVWDCAGQEDFDDITKAYYKDADGVVLVFSTNDRSSFEMIKKWKSKFDSSSNISRVSGAVLVQNKIDLLEESAIDPLEAENLARDLKIRFYRVSAKDNVQVHPVFQYLAELCIKKKTYSASVASNKSNQKTIELFQVDSNSVESKCSSKDNRKRRADNCIIS